jgi:hypothetical protein
MQEESIQALEASLQQAEDQMEMQSATMANKSSSRKVLSSKQKMDKSERREREQGWNSNTMRAKTFNKQAAQKAGEGMLGLGTRTLVGGRTTVTVRGPRAPIDHGQQQQQQQGGGGGAMDQQYAQANQQQHHHHHHHAAGNGAPLGNSNGFDNQVGDHHHNGGNGASSSSSSSVDELQRAIQDEERRLMAIEEERRWRQYEQQAAGGAAVGAAGAGAQAGSGGDGGGGGGQQFVEEEIEVELPQTAAELKEALDWLREPKLCQLKERNSERPFEFVATEALGVGAGAMGSGEDDDDGAGYQFQWSEPGMPSVVEGFVLLSDVADIKGVANDTTRTLFTILLRKNSPQAVRNSGGLHSVCVRAGSPSEAAMFRSGLLGLVQAVNASAV